MVKIRKIFLISLFCLFAFTACELKTQENIAAIETKVNKEDYSKPSVQSNETGLVKTKQENIFPIKIREKTIFVSLDKYEKMGDEASFAKGFLPKTKGLASLGPYIWVYTLPMTDEDRIKDIKVSDQEYMNVTISPGDVMFALYIDKGDYWVHCRVYFDDPDKMFWNQMIDITDNNKGYDDFKTRQDFLLHQAINKYEDGINEVRNMMYNDF